MRKALYILGELNDSDLDWLVENGQNTTHAKGTALISAGEQVSALYIVTEGKCSVVLRDGVAFDTMSVGDIAGEMSLIEKRLPSVSVIADTEVRTLSIAQSRVQEHLKEDNAFASRFYRAMSIFLSDRLRGVSERQVSQNANQEGSYEDSNELDEVLLDSVWLAGDRLRRILAKLEGRAE